MKVRVTKVGDSELRIGQTLNLTVFLAIVKAILEAGGEMPIAVLA